tara:strand:- start:436 stop:1161 length:726 start_codon:yes stop_codon:yes gene_type:complete
MKRLADILIAFFLLLISSPILLLTSLLVFIQDWQSPFYISPRVGKDGRLFSMVKLRSMIVNADTSGVDSTSKNDSRITPIGKFIRRYKLDEITQMWNVLIGHMSLVGPRPNVKTETDLYSEEEKELLKVKPGITDFSSIIFSDEGDILANEKDPDLAYNQLIRPWKSRLGIIYINNNNLILDLKLLFYTFVLIFDRQASINWVVQTLETLRCSQKIITVCTRVNPLIPYPPPGFDDIVSER